MKELSKIVQESVSLIDELESRGQLFNGTDSVSRVEARNTLISSQISLLEAELERKKEMMNSRLIGIEESNRAYKFKTDGYHKACKEDISYLQDQITKCKELMEL